MILPTYILATSYDIVVTPLLPTDIVVVLAIGPAVPTAAAADAW